jgi:hypothetical protein
VYSGIPDPDDQFSFHPGLRGEAIRALLVDPIVFHPPDGIGSGRCGQHKRLMASNLDKGKTGDDDEHKNEQQDQEHLCQSLHPWA